MNFDAITTNFLSPESKVILECVVGSTVHGTSVDDGLEDLDLMAIFIESPLEFIGFTPTDTVVKRTKPVGVRSEAGDVDYTAYGLCKFLSLALKGNPSILLALFAPDSHTRVCSPEGAALRTLVPAIASKRAYGPFRGYMRQQTERLKGTRGQRNVTRPELVQAYGFDTKYAGHIVRLGYQGEELLRTGRITLPMPDKQRRMVLDVRTGKYTLDQVFMMLEASEIRLQNAFDDSRLRDEPDVDAIEQWMISAYVKHWAASPPVTPHAAWPFST